MPSRTACVDGVMLHAACLLSPNMSSDCTARALGIYSVGNQHGCRVQKVINASASNFRCSSSMQCRHVHVYNRQSQALSVWCNCSMDE